MAVLGEFYEVPESVFGIKRLKMVWLVEFEYSQATQVFLWAYWIIFDESQFINNEWGAMFKVNVELYMKYMPSLLPFVSLSGLVL